MKNSPLEESTTRGTHDSSSARSLGERWLGRVAWVQGLFYFVTGVWPIVHLRSFLWVTGPKTDLWLVQTVGGVLAVIGLVLWLAGRRGRVTPELIILGAGSAAVLTAIDVIFVSKGTISPIYLLDALAEVVLIVAWIVSATRDRAPAGRVR